MILFESVFLLPASSSFVALQVFSLLWFCHPPPAEAWRSSNTFSNWSRVCLYCNEVMKHLEQPPQVLYSHLQLRHEMFTFASLGVQHRRIESLVSPFQAAFRSKLWIVHYSDLAETPVIKLLGKKFQYKVH